MSDDTPILSLPLILPAQAQKHVTHNEALRLLDVLVQLAVLDRTRTAAPATPAEGDRHLIASAATGIWTGLDGQIACFWGGAWLYLPPQDGWMLRVLAEGITLARQAGLWVDTTPDLTATDHLGINATADSTNRLAVSAPATLLTHDGAGHQVKINKATPTDTASLLFQSGWQGRAELGLAGSDGFAVKVSPDGAAWATALLADPATGAVTLPHPVTLGAQTTAPTPAVDGQMWLDGPSGQMRIRTGGTVQTVGLADGNRGDVAVSANGAQWTLAAGTVTNAKLAPMASGCLKGRYSTASGAVEDLTPAQARDILDLPTLTHLDFYDSGRFASAVGVVGPFAAMSVASGTISSPIPTAAILGVNPFGVLIRSSATANSGFRYMTMAAVDYLGVTSRKLRTKCLWRTTAGTTVRIGFHNLSSAADTNHGAYFEIIGDQITAKTAAHSVRSVHETAFTLSENTHYTFDIEADAQATGIRFRVWDGATFVPVMDATLSTTLPTSVATAFGAGVIATHAGTVATELIILYEMAIGTIAGFRRQMD